ncbi:hypothetical protein BDW69DRAFT_64744 [Aspergillus filifer]
MPYSRTTLISAIKSLLDAFSSGADTPTLLSTFTTFPEPTIHEHGLKELAPFLGRPFIGQEQLKTYFGLLSEHLGIEDASFDSEDEWAVDAESMVVALRGKARFKSKKTGQAWDEIFAYMIEIAEGEGSNELKVRRYEIWADTGAAYLALRGELKGLTG